MEVEGVDFELVPNRHGWFGAEIGTAYNRPELIELARRFNRGQREQFCLVGFLEPSGHSLFIVPTRDPFSIIDWFGFPADELDCLRSIHAENPLQPTFADPRGFHCDFQDKVSEDLANLLNAKVTTAAAQPMLEDFDDVGDFALIHHRLSFFYEW